MCLLSVKPASAKWNSEHLKQSLVSNRDGWGMIGIRKGRLFWRKGFDVASMLEALPLFQDVEAIYHARYATHGTKTLDQLHPYKVVGDIHMAHNGVFDINTPDISKSDTWHMARRLGSMGYDALLSCLSDPEWIKELGKSIPGNKIAFINPKTGVVIVNEHLGHIVDGVWMSNAGYKPNIFDKGGITTYKPLPVPKPVSLADYSFGDLPSYFDISPEEMVASWLESRSPRYMIAADISTSSDVVVDAIMLLMKEFVPQDEKAMLEDIYESTFL
jgi:hypothetical protein